VRWMTWRAISGGPYVLGAIDGGSGGGSGGGGGGGGRRGGGRGGAQAEAVLALPPHRVLLGRVSGQSLGGAQELLQECRRAGVRGGEAAVRS